jgi:hypothetical protein
LNNSKGLTGYANHIYLIAVLFTSSLKPSMAIKATIRYLVEHFTVLTGKLSNQFVADLVAFSSLPKIKVPISIPKNNNNSGRWKNCLIRKGEG